MRIMTINALFLVLVLTGCGSVDVAAPVIPASLMVPCDKPVALPSRDLTSVEVEVLWGRDRSALRTCGSRHGALVDANGA